MRFNLCLILSVSVPPSGTQSPLGAESFEPRGPSPHPPSRVLPAGPGELGGDKLTVSLPSEWMEMETHVEPAVRPPQPVPPFQVLAAALGLPSARSLPGSDGAVPPPCTLVHTPVERHVRCYTDRCLNGPGLFRNHLLQRLWFCLPRLHGAGGNHGPEKMKSPAGVRSRGAGR